MAVLYAARKYGFDRLVSHCLQIPKKNLPNVFLAHAQARLFNLENLLCELFERDQLVISNEFEIWKAALRWADEKCRQNAIECSAENRRAALGPALFKIRFPLISTEDFTSSIVPSGVLTTDEFLSVYQFHCHPNLRGVPGLKPLEFPWHGRISDWNIARGKRGTLVIEIEKFSEFTKEEVGSRRNSEIEVCIKGLSWKMSAEIKIDEKGNEKWLGFYLLFTGPKEVKNWSYKCSATFRIVSQKSGTEDWAKKYDHICKDSYGWGFLYFIAIAELMMDKGLYDKNEDKVTLAIDFKKKEQKSAN
ncbi:hypothetical protein niasHS_015389 [Heterodera schachtii]|uniref:MATH domain-containing protein n=1 Tax=Heterodera schachtii TaxID=97005 RepID=A0ABD2HS97_HETSC